MNENYSICLLNIEDEEALCKAVQVINEAFLKQVVARTDRQTTSVQELKNHLSDRSKEAFILVDPNQIIVGVALITLEPTYVYIWCVSVANAHQKADLGTKLMLFIEQRSFKIHKKKLAVLSVVYHPEHNQGRLINWYESQGYHFCYDQVPSNVAKIWKPEFHMGLTLKIFQKNLVDE